MAGNSPTGPAARSDGGQGAPVEQVMPEQAESTTSPMRHFPTLQSSLAINTPSNDVADTTSPQSSPTMNRRSRGEHSSTGTYGSLTEARPSRPDTSSVDKTTNNEPGMPSQPHSGGSSILHQDRPPTEPSERPKKPHLGRRGTSQTPGPHRGQEFSVDDDREEVEEQFAQRLAPLSTSSGRGTLGRKISSTLRRRIVTTQPTILARVDSSSTGEAHDEIRQPQRETSSSADDTGKTTHRLSEEETQTAVDPEHGEDRDDAGEAADDDKDEDEEEDVSDTESFTLKDRQDAINETHPFGVRIWKPALYKKKRSVQKNAEGDIHSSPGGRVSQWLWFFNLCWTLLFGWWLATATLLGAIVCFIFGMAPGSLDYGRVLFGLSRYLLFPFGQFVKLEQDETYAEEDEGEGRSIGEYEQWQNGDLEDGRLFFGPLTSRSLVGRRRNSIESADENDSLLGRTRRGGRQEEGGLRNKRRLFGRGQWNIGRVIFFVFFYGLIAPLLLFVSLLCWMMVFWIPMGKVTILLFYHLRRHPLALSFHSDGTSSRRPGSSSSSILLCTYRAVGTKYWKYTIDGTNIFLINLMAVVLFTIFDYWVLDVSLSLNIGLTHPAIIFTLALVSIVPLAYFIGQAVASISAQSSMGVGAAVNAFFSTIVEVFLYCVALKQGKGKLVEGSVIGSIFAGILFLPGLSMCFGAIKRKTQRFNAKSAGVTSTMLLFAMIAAFGPTLFYQIYGSHELNCLSCIDAQGNEPGRDCRRCYFSQEPAINDRFYITAVRPYTWFAAVTLFLAYIIGLWFTLRTHAAVIWATEADEKKLLGIGLPTISGLSQPEHAPLNGTSVPGHMTGRNTAGEGNAHGRNTAVRDSPMYKRILGQSLKAVAMNPQISEATRVTSPTTSAPPHDPYMLPPKGTDGEANYADASSRVHIPGFTTEQDQRLVQEVAEMAATAATVAARDAVRAHPRKTSVGARNIIHSHRPAPQRDGTFAEFNDEAAAVEALGHGGGHDAPNWSRTKSSIILVSATVLYAVIAEVLVDTVDVVLESVDIDEKFLGMTLFALVPNTTEFLNAISFAMNGNIALSMEIGSAYALQVCLLQIPALVLFSAVNGQFIDTGDLLNHTFTLIFPQFDMVTVILCVFLLSYMYGEGKSNYFKGSILILSYLVVMAGFYFSGFSEMSNGVDGSSRFDILTGTGSERQFRTVGRSMAGKLYPG